MNGGASSAQLWHTMNDVELMCHALIVGPNWRHTAPSAKERYIGYIDSEFASLVCLPDFVNRMRVVR